MRLKDKVAVVTGSSRSIGRAIALGIRPVGRAKVVINYRSDRGAADSAVGEIEEIGSEAIAVQADTSSSSDVAELMAATFDRFGRIDILVNNAGILIRTPFLEIEESEWDRILEVNLKGILPVLPEAAAKQMVQQGEGGVIINMSSAGDTLAGRTSPTTAWQRAGCGCSPANLRPNSPPTGYAPTPSPPG